MINNTTLNILNKDMYGANISELESKIIDYKYSKIICKYSETEYINILESYLSSIDNKSKALKNNDILPIDYDVTDKLFERYLNNKATKTFGNDLDNLSNDLISSECDLIAMLNICGVDIRITYLNGTIYKAFAIGENNKYIDISQIAKDIMPNNIERFNDIDTVDLIGKLTVIKEKSQFDAYTASVRYCRLGIHDDRTLIIIDNIQASNDIGFSNNLDMLTFLREQNINVPHHAVIRNITQEDFKQALIEFNKYFVNTDEKACIVYNYSGINIKDNNQFSNNYIMNFETNNIDEHRIFESEVKDIQINNNCIELIIDEVKCNINKTVDRVCIHDLYLIEQYKLFIGKKIKFRLINNNICIIEDNSNI